MMNEKELPNRFARTSALLDERSQTHGEFAENARISQRLKDIFREEGEEQLTVIQLEALDMMAVKISRILSGHAHFPDHWDDIAGYARLASLACG